MIIDARALPKNHEIVTDICIVGGGVAGMSLALELMGQPYQVCILESGGMELDAETQSLARGENVGLEYFPLGDARPRCFGGSSYNWFVRVDKKHVGIQVRPLDSVDFEERPWVPYSGWPFSKAHLNPYYERAHSICQLGPYTYDPTDWIDDRWRPQLPLCEDAIKTVMFRLGLRDVFVDSHRQRIQQAENVTTYLHATVLEIETTASGSSAARLCVAPTLQKRMWVSAKMYVLALGGIETPRFLLLSRKRQAEGLGNQYDLVGRFFMEHPHLQSGTYLTTKIDIDRAAALYEHHTSRVGRGYGRLALSEGVLRQEQLLNWCVSIEQNMLGVSVRGGLTKIFETSKKLGKSFIRGNLTDCRWHINNLLPFLFNDLTPSIARKTMSLIRKRALNYISSSRRTGMFSLHHMSEQAPNPNSRVSLSDEKDCFGQQRVKLNWQLSPLDVWRLLRSQQIFDEELRRAGLGRLDIEMTSEIHPLGLSGGWHHMGTTRMHRNSQCGVVNEDCRIHGMRNVFIAGPSTFPTSGYANPTLTIVALAIRLADHLKGIMKNGSSG